MTPLIRSSRRRCSAAIYNFSGIWTKQKTGPGTANVANISIQGVQCKRRPCINKGADIPQPRSWKDYHNVMEEKPYTQCILFLCTREMGHF